MVLHRAGMRPGGRVGPLRAATIGCVVVAWLGLPVAGGEQAADAAVVEGHSAPRRAECEPWLGTYAAGPETVTLRWEDGLVVDLDRISVPVDGRWHETVPTFAVRHRIGWLAERRVLTLEEQHNQGARWRYELRFRDGGLDKVLMAGQAGDEETLVRTYHRRSSIPS